MYYFYSFYPVAIKISKHFFIYQISINTDTCMSEIYSLKGRDYSPLFS